MKKILLIVIIALLTGCGRPGDPVSFADNICLHRNGVSSVAYDQIINLVRVTCNNGFKYAGPI